MFIQFSPRSIAAFGRKTGSAATYTPPNIYSHCQEATAHLPPVKNAPMTSLPTINFADRN